MVSNYLLFRFGPNTISHVLKELVKENSSFGSLDIYVSTDGTMYKSHVNMAENRSLLILIPLLLGLGKTINSIYVPKLKKLFSFAECVGIAGGEPKSSFYFIGCHEENFIYLDPHEINESTFNVMFKYL